MVIVQLVPLALYQPGIWWGGFLLIIVLINGLHLFLATLTIRQNAYCLWPASLLLLWLTLGVACAEGRGLSFRRDVITFVETLPQRYIFVTSMGLNGGKRGLTILAGMLLVSGEANALVRWLLEVGNLVPTRAAICQPTPSRMDHAPDSGHAASPGKPQQMDATSRRASESLQGARTTVTLTSRLLGNVERVLFFLLVLEGAYEFIGLIIAAKQIPRLRERSDRDRAEYVLLGTLLSLLVALVIALGFRAVLR